MQSKAGLIAREAIGPSTSCTWFRILVQDIGSGYWFRMLVQDVSSGRAAPAHTTMGVCRATASSASRGVDGLFSVDILTD